MLTLTHIINPINVPETSDLFVAQPVTFETLKRAKEFAKQEVKVHLITTQFPEDHSIIPEFFTKTKNLDRSVLDFGTFEKIRKLPMLQDILDRAVDYHSEADYIIYTNVDIAVQPHFYSFIKQKIEEGYDAFVINRRTVGAGHTLKTLAEAYAEIGEAHPGYDCFVFKKDHYADYFLDHICVGAVYVGLALYLNLRLCSTSFLEVPNQKLTFHIGNDQIWKDESNLPFENFNKEAFEKIKDRFKIKKSEVDAILGSAFSTLKKQKEEAAPTSRFSLGSLFLKKQNFHE
jgi:hypothetical protein